MQNPDLETLAFEGIQIVFKFKNDRPTFGDLFLICGFENPNFLPNSRAFEKLTALRFEQVDDYFGIRNENDIGDDVLVWLYPIVNNEEVYHHPGPFDAIRIDYVIIRNETKHLKLIEEIFNSFNSNLDVEVYFYNQLVNDFSIINNKARQVIEYCRSELKVEPGSKEAMGLDW